MNVSVNLSFRLITGLRGGRGQVLVEYGLVLLLIVIVVLLMLTGIGKTTNNTYSTINSKISSAMQ